jgi:sec-independent protein translocase protein TatB
MTMQPTIQYASLGMADSLILMVLALVVFGPRRLPQIGRQIGKLMYEFRKASNDFKFQMEEELRNAEESDRRKQEEERLRAMALAAPVTAELPAAVHETVIDPQFPIPSPYPGEVAYPSVPSVDPDSPAPAGEPVAPVIQPPSTGEQVPAARPGSLASQVSEIVVTPETAVPEPPATTEQAHG